MEQAQEAKAKMQAEYQELARKIATSDFTWSSHNQYLYRIANLAIEMHHLDNTIAIAQERIKHLSE